MKRILILIFTLVIVSCKPEVKDYVTLSGKIDNKGPITSLNIFNEGRTFNKTLTINEDGTFSDTLKVDEGLHVFNAGNLYGTIYLKNNNVSSFSLDAEQPISKTLKFSGDDADKSNFFIENITLLEKHLTQDLMFKSEDEFNQTFTNLKEDYKQLKASKNIADSTFFKKPDEELEKLKNLYTTHYNKQNAILKVLPKGSPSPTFKNYENYDGSKTSLSDFKGKYVYIDVWATWCRPCTAEIPALKKLEKEYHGKNIQFISLSVDDDRTHGGSWDKARKDWKTMVKDKQLSGVQLFAPKGFLSQFPQDYKINSIPRFLLIDPNGNIVSPNAPRPSNNEAVRALFTSLGI